MTADKTMRTVTCIQCPLGCMVSVGLADDGTVDSVEGAACARGRAFASEEAVRPVRVLTLTIPVQGSLVPLSVKTSKPVPKSCLRQVVGAVNELKMTLPIAAGDVLLANVCETGADIVATRSLG
ncbi:MAG: DUF1667 domain-containing protein [Adlercreutzia mucosicola]|nr:DUF1667 domain-containing protein [Adlercreutzia mucosicola]